MDTTPVTRRGPWAPVLEDSDERLVAEILESIAEALTGYDIIQMYGVDLARGSAGVAIFFSYLSRIDSAARWAHHASLWLSRSVEASAGFQGTSLYHGVTGVAWAVEHLGGYPASAEADPRFSVDRMLLHHVQQRPGSGDYDLIGGLTGIGVYALERLGSRAGAELLERVLDRLSEIAVHTDDGNTWWTAPQRLPEQARANHPRGYFNLGLAHGVPGVIALLGQACAAGVAVRKARPLLDKAVRWLLAHRNPETAASSLAMFVSDGRLHPDGYARVRWCYGDLGASAALFSAALNVHDRSLQRQALEIARRAAVYPMGRAGVGDAGLCHGAAGNGHIFNRLYQATGEDVFLDAARRWFRRALQFYRPGTGIGGFRAWTGKNDPDDQWFDVPGITLGPAGIGLALLGAVSAVEPEWDRMLMVAIPPSHSDAP